VFSILVVTGMLAAGFPIRDRHTEGPISPPPCQRGASVGCGASDESGFFQPKPPVRECPADSSMAEVRPGVRYCIPDRPLRD
jgi:hypothetical protein